MKDLILFIGGIITGIVIATIVGVLTFKINSVEIGENGVMLHCTLLRQNADYYYEMGE